MKLFKNQTILILGLGLHGGGKTSIIFANSQGAKKILVSELAQKSRFDDIITSLSHIPITCEFETHSNTYINNADCIIKNPAIPPKSPAMHYILQQNKHIETDISLFFRCIHKRNSNTQITAITGTKGKSSISTAIHKLLSSSISNNAIQKDNTTNISSSIRSVHHEQDLQDKYPQSVLVGNIRTSPLILIMNDIYPKNIVCELSAQQIGDLQYVSQVYLDNLNCLVFSNFMRDHLNFYETMEQYFTHKSYLFKKASSYPCNIAIPHDIWGERLASFFPSEQCVWHSKSILTTEKRGAWFDKKHLWYRKQIGQKAICLHELGEFTYNYYTQNILTVIAYCIAMKKSVPKNINTWKQLFTLEHRKEYLGNKNGINYINDSAATIPQAMQITNLCTKNVRLICGGTDKNLIPEDIIPECQAATHCYFLEGNYTSQILPLLHKTNITYSGPFPSLHEALHTAVADSNNGDTIILSPGCASFGMFQHEFDRGNIFKKLVQSL